MNNKPTAIICYGDTTASPNHHSRAHMADSIVKAYIRGNLGAQIVSLIQDAGIEKNQRAISKKLGIDQTRVSRLMNNHIDRFSTERLMIFILKLEGHIVMTFGRPHTGNRQLEAKDMMPNNLVLSPDLLRSSSDNLILN